jgi:hypothetical protein
MRNYNKCSAVKIHTRKTLETRIPTSTLIVVSSTSRVEILNGEVGRKDEFFALLLISSSFYVLAALSSVSLYSSHNSPHEIIHATKNAAISADLLQPIVHSYSIPKRLQADVRRLRYQPGTQLRICMVCPNYLHGLSRLISSIAHSSCAFYCHVKIFVWSSGVVWSLIRFFRVLHEHVFLKSCICTGRRRSDVSNIIASLSYDQMSPFPNLK